MSLLNRLQYTEAPGWTILVRLLVGLIVFFPEGIQKLLFPDILGAGRFARIGIPFPEMMGRKLIAATGLALAGGLVAPAI